MRKLILIAAMVLVSATAQAGEMRGLTVASSDGQAATEQPKTAEAPKYVGRPSIQQQSSRSPQGQNPAAAQNAQTLRAAQLKHRRPSVLARVVYALHRHGIYW
jgi:hypothetical protein